MYKALPEFNPDNTQVFLDIAIGFEHEALEDRDHARIVLELFDSHLPLTCENFRVLCSGERGQRLCYHGSRFFRVVPGFMM